MQRHAFCSEACAALHDAAMHGVLVLLDDDGLLLSSLYEPPKRIVDALVGNRSAVLALLYCHDWTTFIIPPDRKEMH